MLESVCPPRRMRFSFESRCRIVALIVAGQGPQQAAACCGASRATGYRLWSRFQQGSWQALQDRPSTPKRQPARLPPEAEAEILRWREHLRAGPLVIAAAVDRPASTVGKVLRRAGCSRLPRPQRDRRVRYERARPGELLHVDTKKLGRFHQVGKRILQDGVQRSPRAGWQHLHVAIDDHSRARLLRAAPRPRPLRLRRLPPPSRRLVRRAGHHDRTRALGQREGLPLSPLGQHLYGARDRTPLHPPLLALDERQSRSADQDPAPRVGIPLQLPHERPPRPRPAWLHQVVQPPQTHGSLAGHPPTSRVSHLCGQYT